MDVTGSLTTENTSIKWRLTQIKQSKGIELRRYSQTVKSEARNHEVLSSISGIGGVFGKLTKMLFSIICYLKTLMLCLTIQQFYAFVSFVNLYVAIIVVLFAQYPYHEDCLEQAER